MAKEKIYCKDVKRQITKGECWHSKDNNNCITCSFYKQATKETSKEKKIFLKKENRQYMGLSLPPSCPEDSLPVYTRHPEIKEFRGDAIESNEWHAEKLNREPAHSTEIEIKTKDSLKMVSLFCKQDGFKRTKNPLYAIEAFLLSYEIGLYPPLWALTYVTEIFKTYHASSGKSSLDNLFGIIKKNQHTSKFKAEKNEERNGIFMRDLFRLTVIGYTINDASAMIEARANNTKWDGTGLKLKNLNKDTIQQMYTRKWKYYFNCERVINNTKMWFENNKNEFLNTFPEELFKKYKPHKTLKK